VKFEVFTEVIKSILGYDTAEEWNTASVSEEPATFIVMKKGYVKSRRKWCRYEKMKD
jgi:hypothetical protein